VAAALTLVLESARQSFQLMLSVGAGTGLIYLLRWYWWRINAWSEVAAMAGSFAIAAGFFVAERQGAAIPAHLSLLATVAATTAIWVAATLLTPATERSRLVAFYEHVRPAGPGWRSVREEAGLPPSADSLPQMLLGWVLGCAFIYAALFGSGSFLYGKVAQGTVWLVVFVVSGAWLARLLRRRSPERGAPAGSQRG
jgi:SSS family solute:Na+ symporter